VKRPPTDREILQKIHDRYLKEFGEFKKGDPKSERQTKIYVPIDCKAIASDLKVDSDIVFGRLYYHLDKKYGYRQDDGSKVHLFAFALGNERHAVNFPLLSAILAELKQSWFQFAAPLVISFIALLVSLVSLLCGS
jgi:hypothetical protein